MQPRQWQPLVALSAAERAIITRIKRAKRFVFLRLWRHELFEATFQAELAAMYQESPKGQPPVPPAQLALATVLQAYTGASDDEVIEATLMDRRWQLVLDCHEAATPPFSKGTLVGFRQRLIAHDLDRRLVERTVELAERVATGRKQSPGSEAMVGRGKGSGGGFSPRALRAALDSSPLWGAGRVEDTSNLLGHALRKALALVARQSDRLLADVAAAAGAPVLGGPSRKAALDLNRDDPAARVQALGQVLAALDAVDAYVATQPLHLLTTPEQVQLRASLAAAQQVRTQDVELVAHPAPAATPATSVAGLRQGVARDRRISIEDGVKMGRCAMGARAKREDGAMRHGRKSKA